MLAVYKVGDKVVVIGTKAELMDFHIPDNTYEKTGVISRVSNALHHKNDCFRRGRLAHSYQVGIWGYKSWWYHEDLIRLVDQQMYLQFTEESV